MPSWISRALHQLSGPIGRLIFIMAGFLILWGMLAPITTIVWWLNQTAGSLGFKLENKAEKSPVLQQATVDSPNSQIDCYIVFLPGVGNFSPDEITKRQKYFVDQLAARHPNCVVVENVFPYSVVNKGLGSNRFLAPLWKAAQASDDLVGYEFIKVRNLWRFAISADDRYGPVYNLSIARTIVTRMNVAHPIARSNQPISLILFSTSGGTQVALGATAHLREWINARITVISIGGAFDGRAGFKDANHVYHLYSDSDWIAALPHIVFPARWRVVVGSPVNQARRQGRYTACNVGSQDHDGSQGYFGDVIALNNTSYVDIMLEDVAQLPIWSIDQPLASECPTQKVAPQ